MDRRRLGNTDIEISPLGLGTVKFGRNQGVKYPYGFEIPGEAALADLLALAKDLEINMLDTAPAYGTSEERLGRLLAGQREDWVIVGKAGEEFENGQSVYNFTPEHFEMSLERSLKRLNTDYIDVLMVHSDGNDVENLSDDLIAKMQDFKARGLVRAVGASTKTVEGGIRALEHMDVVMACYNADYTDEKPVLDYAAEHNKGVLLKKVLGSGHFINMSSRTPQVEGSHSASGDLSSQAPRDDIYNAFEFAFGHPGTSGVIMGTINPAHLRANVAAVNRVLAG
ncbi:MAG: aldo/keto reductase [Rhodospirillales bacterium]|nr:aldo/keto reductase [Alphaproteobacteria bacterium]MCB9981681.1 aldo/keto reductase [Rhodospirillales bacterium]